MNAARSRGEGQPRLDFLMMVAVMLIAAAMRIIGLRDAPPGPRFDEAYDALMARRIMSGERPLYFPENFGEEPLNQYLQAVTLTAFGWNDLALRFPSIAFGLVEVAALYALGRCAWSRRAGLAAAALCAVSFWPIFYSRLGLRLIALPAIVAVAVWMLWRTFPSSERLSEKQVQGGQQSAAGLLSSGNTGSFQATSEPEKKGREWVDACAAGILLGLSIYTYPAARILPLWMFGCLIYLAVFHRAQLRRQAWTWVLLVVIAGLIIAPLVGYLVAHPQAENRVEQVSGPLDALRQGNAVPLGNYALAAIGMFGFRGGSEWLYNVPGRPIFDPLTACVFFLGILLALKRWRESRITSVLLWLGVGLVPILLSWPPASTSHAILAQPAAYLLVGLGIDALVSFIVSVRPRRWQRSPSGPPGFVARAGRVQSALPVIVIVILVTLNAGLTVRDYFGVWNGSDQVRWEHQATVTAMGRYADAHPELRNIAFAGTAVDYYNPWMKVGLSLTSRRTDARWLNPARALVWNPSGPMTYLVPFRDPNPVTFNQVTREMFGNSATLTLDARLADGRPLFTTYEIRDASALHAQASASGSRAYDFGARWVLINYQVRPTEARPGDSIRVLTYWRVTQADDSPLVMFTHLLGLDGRLIAQDDRLDVAPETLHVGDEFVQTHRVVLPGDAPAGTYRVRIGLYSPVTSVRVPVAGGDSVELTPVQVVK
jgi:4-amino-4-deoxy-L-arabinose transferase-like glycosyltransferase